MGSGTYGDVLGLCRDKEMKKRRRHRCGSMKVVAWRQHDDVERRLRWMGGNADGPRVVPF
jgi:hypothetical protein